MQADESDFARSARVFNTIGRGAYWDHTMPDDEWRKHCAALRLQDRILANADDNGESS